METTRSERIKLGAFMFFCCVLILVFLGYIFQRFLNKQYDNYYTIIKGSVIGLYTEAKVKLNGIDVGNVTGIDIDSTNLEQVIVRFKVNRGTPVKTGTRAGLTHGISLTGEKQVVLSGGNFHEPDIPEGGYVPASVSSIDKIAETSTNMVSQIDSIVTKINTTLSEENAESISRSLKNIEKITENLSRVTSHIQEPIETITKAGKSMQTVLAEVENARIAEKASEDLTILKEKLESLDTKAMNENLAQTLESVKTLVKQMDLMIYKNQDQVEETLERFNQVLFNLEEFSQKIKNNPSALIRSESSNRR